MTNEQIAAIKRDDVIYDQAGVAWVAKHDAFVPDRDTVDPRVALVSYTLNETTGATTTRLRFLTHNSVDF